MSRKVLKKRPIIKISSVSPDFKLTDEPYIDKKLSEEDIINEMMKHDIVIRMPPIREYSIKLKIKSVEKASPKVIRPEDLWL